MQVDLHNLDLLMKIYNDLSTNCAAVVAVVMSTSFLVVTVWAKQVAFAFGVVKSRKTWLVSFHPLSLPTSCASFMNAEVRVAGRH